MAAIELVDMENVDLLEAVERAFGISICDREAMACRTVGDLLGLIASTVPSVERGALACPTASAFRRIRRAIRASDPQARIEPATPLGSLMPGSRPRAWWRGLSAATGLAFPSLWSSPDTRFRRFVPVLLGAGLFALLAAGFGLASFGIVAAIYFFGSLSAAWFARRDLVLGLGPSATVGDLAEVVSALNAGVLAGPGGLMRTRDIRLALDRVIRHDTGFPGPIDRRTQFAVR